VPAEWHGWLHGNFDGLPESNLPPARIWEVDFTPNVTGTSAAYRPQGALERGGKRAAATGDYEAWSPKADAPRSIAAFASCAGCRAADTERVRRQATCKWPAAEGGDRIGQRSRWTIRLVIESPHGTPVKDRVATLGFLNKRNNITRAITLRSGESAPDRQRHHQARHLRAHRAVGGSRPRQAHSCSSSWKNARRPQEKLAWHKVFSGWLFKGAPCAQRGRAPGL